uniref:Uncharacterized protein n=1 Tax=Sphaerodactylus townsendi TaxID=933632 RepID=A0ACB8FE80_9SAUR
MGLSPLDYSRSGLRAPGRCDGGGIESSSVLEESNAQHGESPPRWSLRRVVRFQIGKCAQGTVCSEGTADVPLISLEKAWLGLKEGEISPRRRLSAVAGAACLIAALAHVSLLLPGLSCGLSPAAARQASKFGVRRRAQSPRLPAVWIIVSPSGPGHGAPLPREPNR